MSSVLQKLFFWNYARNTWQWDALCVVILIFIFLTPKSCFESSERRRSTGHQNPAVSTVLVGPELIENAQDKGQVAQVLRTFTGRNELQVLNVRAVFDKEGKPKPLKEGQEPPAIGPRQWKSLQSLIVRAEGKAHVAPASDPRPALVLTPAADDFTNEFV